MSLLKKAVSAAYAIVSVNTQSGESRGTLSSYVVGAPHEYGQPYEVAASIADVQGLVTPDRMREVVMKTPTASACLNAFLDYAVGVPVGVRSKDPSKLADPQRLMHVQNYLERPNENDTWRSFRAKIYRDVFTLGWGAVELEPDEEGGVANLHPLDAGRLRIDYDEHGTVLGYNMVDAYGRPISKNGTPWGWSPNEVIPIRLNPTSHSLYSTSRIAQLFILGIIEDYMMHFIGTRFTDSNVPYGLLDLGEITQQELEAAIASWNGQAQKQHKILLTGSKGAKWFPFAYNLSELQATSLLSDIRSRIMGIVGITMNELGESQDVNKSNGYNLSYTFKKRAIEPPIDEFNTSLTRFFIWDRLGYTDLEMYAEEIDSRDELLQAQIDDVYLKNGVYSPNHIANRKGLPSVQGGDDRLISTGSAWIPIDLVRAFAEAQLAAILAVEQPQGDGEGGGGGGGSGNPNISPPLIRPPKMPEQFTTIDGSGSSNVKIRYPREPGNGTTQQKPRGPTQALRNVGLRREDHAS